MVAEIWASVISSFVDQLVALKSARIDSQLIYLWSMRFVNISVGIRSVC